MFLQCEPFPSILAIEEKTTLNPDKTTCTPFTPDPAEYKSNLDLKINNTALYMATHPKVLDLTFDPKLTFTACQYNHTSHYK